VSDGHDALLVVGLVSPQSRVFLESVDVWVASGSVEKRLLHRKGNSDHAKVADPGRDFSRGFPMLLAGCLATRDGAHEVLSKDLL
jgi:hypothetical protein